MSDFQGPEGAAEALPCFVRRIKGLPRFQGAFLVRSQGRWHLVYRRWFRTRSLELGTQPARSFPGLLWDTVVFLRGGRPELLLVSRAWRRTLSIPGSAQA